MAYVKVVAKSGAIIGRAINYAGNERKAEYRSGLNCSDDPATATMEMNQTKEMYGKLDGRQYKHFIQSFAPGEVSPEKAHEIGREWAARNFKGYEVYIGTHVDRTHIHNHFIVNSVNFENGEKYHKSERFLDELKLDSDRICKREGLSIIQPDKEKYRGEIRGDNLNKYQLLQRVYEGQNVKSYLVETGKTVHQVAQCSGSRKEFITSMEKAGYIVSWKEDRKHVTFQDSDGHKVRLSNLEKTFNDDSFTKEGLQREFSKVEYLRENSYLVEMADTVQSAVQNSMSRQKFITTMGMEGYRVSWKEDKDITFQDTDGHEVSLSDLKSTFDNGDFTKEGLVNEFSRPSESTRGNNSKRTWGNETTEREPGRENGTGKYAAERELGEVRNQIRGIEQSVERAEQSASSRNAGNEIEFDGNDELILERDFERELESQKYWEEHDREL